MDNTRNEIDSRQYPDWSEFEQTGEGETAVRPKEGFYFGFGFGSSKWRLREESDILYVEYWDGSAWTEQARFEV